MTLTPTQIEYVERWLAERLMGWHVTDWPRSHFCRCQNEKHLAATHAVDDWHPMSNPAQAAMCREKMREDWTIESEAYSKKELRSNSKQDPYWYQFSRVTNAGIRVRHSAHGPTESLASSLALFYATGGKLEEEP